MRPSIIVAALALAGPVLPTRAISAQAAGTSHEREPLITTGDAITAGAFALATVAAYPLDKHVADYFQGAPQTNRFLRDVAIVVRDLADPGSLLIGGALYGAGRATHSARMASLGLHGTEAIVLGLGITTAIKVPAGRARPYVDRARPHDFALFRGLRRDAYRSFPSGHSVMAFAAAAAVTDETRRWWPRSVWYVAPTMYGGATLVALSRMYDDQHWASDVIVGAAIGQFAGRKIVRYTHSHPNNRLDRWLLGVSIGPNGAGGRGAHLLLVPVR
jgi:membrane-associated phospholipid phosphatase